MEYTIGQKLKYTLSKNNIEKGIGEGKINFYFLTLHVP